MKKHTILFDRTIKAGIKAIKKSGHRCVGVVNKHNKMLGTLSDGDVRKIILNNISINKKLNNNFNKKGFYFFEGKYTETQARSLFLKQHYAIIPVVNKNKIVKDILYWDKLFGNKKKRYPKLHIPVVIMSGGKGTRLEPFTKILPKPLIPIRAKPVIEHIIDKFLEYGIKYFILTTNFKAEIIKAYYKDLKPKYKLEFIKERKPLGTAGCLRKLSKKKYNNFFVTNCDTIAKINLFDFYKFHISNKFDITIAASSKIHKVPYGVCKLDDQGNLHKIDEKPKINILANIGLYLINKKVLTLIPENKLFHMTDLIEKSKKNGFKIGVFPVGEKEWIDVGQWNEFKKTIDIFA